MPGLQFIFTFNFSVCFMIRFKLGEVMEKKRLATGRRLLISEIAAATGLGQEILTKILSQKGYGTSTDTIDRLCDYFNCSVEDLMERIPKEVVAHI